jgi:gliding motility-associated-like protein
VITQIVNNAGDCPDELTKEITVENHYWIRFPNVFSPNGDNLNDYFNPKHYKIKSYTLKIFDRWGEQVFNGAVPLIEHRWYGDRLDGEKSDQAVYYYQCVFTTNRDLVFEQEGTVTLIK